MKRTCTRYPFAAAAFSAVAFILLTSGANAFPTWIGVYGGYVRHDGGNPGEFTVLMNQNYYGLHAQVGIKINDQAYTRYSMSWDGSPNGDSRWKYSPAQAFPPGATVQYYFRGYDDWGGVIYDSNNGNDYSFSIPTPTPSPSPTPSPTPTPSPSPSPSPSPTPTPSPTPSPTPVVLSAYAGMGAIPYSGGTTFRVWAPNADSVSVMGSFNGYDKDANPLAFETSSSDGLWSADVVDAVPGDDYEYVIRYEDQTLYRTDPRALQVENSVGKGIIVDPECDWSSFSTPPFHKQVIYELHIGTFNDNPGGAPGTWNSATQKLDYLHDLGVNMIEVMPVGEFAGDFSWGYNPAFPFAPESAYGTVDDMRNFVEQAHQRDMGVIIDLVHNHWGPSDLDMWCFDGPSYGNGGIYFYSDWKKSTPWGDTRPDYGRYQVRKYIKDNALYWLEDMHCDGLRWDSTTNIDVGDGWNLMQWCNDKIDQSQSWKISIAEDLQNNEWVTKATGAGGAGFDSQWDAGFVHPIRAAIITTNDSDRDMYSVRDAITHKYNGDHVQRVIYTESHDEVANGKSRVPEEIWPGNADSWASQKRSTLGAAIVMTSPGIPMIFEGQELLEDRYFQDTDPIDWTRATTFNGIHDLYRDLIRLRRDWYSTTKGLQGNNVNVFHVNNSAKVIAYHRYDAGGPGDDVIVVANFSNRSFSSYNIGFPRGGTWKVRFNSDWNHYGPFDNFYAYDTVANSGGKDGFGYNGNIGIGKYTAIILSQD